jgi:hypothetical protein
LVRNKQLKMRKMAPLSFWYVFMINVYSLFMEVTPIKSLTFPGIQMIPGCFVVLRKITFARFGKWLEISTALRIQRSMMSNWNKHVISSGFLIDCRTGFIGALWNSHSIVPTVLVSFLFQNENTIRSKRLMESC